LSFRRNWKKHKKAVLSQALLKYSLKQKAWSKIQRNTCVFHCRPIYIE
jgi:hypothetical protein